jgi:translation initiation factor IF-1
MFNKGGNKGGNNAGGFKKPGMHNNPNKNKNRGRGSSRGGGAFLSGSPKVFNDPNSEANKLRRAQEGIKRGQVVEALPNAMFRVEYEDGSKGLAMIGGKLKVYKIRILVGDMIEAVIDPYSKKGRIVKRG